MTLEEFFVMPGVALTALEAELMRMMPAEGVSGVLFRFGYRCGDTMVSRMDIKAEDVLSPDLLSELWMQVGLGRMKEARWLGEDEMEVVIEDPLPDADAAYPEGAFPFHRGYLSGVLTGLTDGHFHCEMVARRGREVLFLLKRRETR